ncbi:Alkbh6 protein [Coccidioides immitis RS]|uniref:Alkbh6 protein n=4 Tax=Coccidioides immitis TaxID=5501 RepID=J3KCE5_COCIM|nr:Alkbh6 protein [Coccidioides immitis RS]EAS32901.3 Alkbh6 protein [Coccidioides immitis RS]
MLYLTALSGSSQQKTVQMANDLAQYRIKSLPETAYYIPEFISEDEEDRLLNKITTVPLPRWTHLTRRRLQSWPSALTNSNTLLESPLPAWLVTPVITRFQKLAIFSASPHKAPNHVLINEYQPGQGIMPHEDGPAYHPLVATVSIGAPIVLDIYEKKNDGQQVPSMTKDTSSADTGKAPLYRILQEPRSLLITTDKLYTDYMHGIAEKTSDDYLGPETICNWDHLVDKAPFGSGSYERETRISLTYRDVLRVSKLGNTMKFLNKR